MTHEEDLSEKLDRIERKLDCLLGKHDWEHVDERECLYGKCKVCDKWELWGVPNL